MLTSSLLLLLASPAAANPGLLSAIGRDPAKFAMVFDGMALDSMFISSDDVGVKRFNFTTVLSNPVYPHSPPQLSVRLHVFMKYMVHDGFVTIKSVMSAETRDISRTPPSLFVHVTFQMTSASHGDSRKHSFKASAAVHSYWDPPAQVCTWVMLAATAAKLSHATAATFEHSARASACFYTPFRKLAVPMQRCSQAAMVYGFETRFDVGNDWQTSPHHWNLTTDVDPTVRQYHPVQELNLLDGRGIFVPPVQPSNNMARETYVVLKPLYNFSTYLFGPLIFRHVEYYQVRAWAVRSAPLTRSPSCRQRLRGCCAKVLSHTASAASDSSRFIIAHFRTIMPAGVNAVWSCCQCPVEPGCVQAHHLPAQREHPRTAAGQPQGCEAGAEGQDRAGDVGQHAAA